MSEPYYDPSDRPDDDLTREEFEAAMQGSPEPPTVEKRCKCARPEITAFNRRCRACNLLSPPPAERPTPITDAASKWGDLQGYEIVHSDVARDLERQLAEAQELQATWERIAIGGELRRTQAERTRDMAIKQRDTLADALRKIAANPGDCDMEFGFTSGHIARAALSTLNPETPTP